MTTSGTSKVVGNFVGGLSGRCMMTGVPETCFYSINKTSHEFMRI